MKRMKVLMGIVLAGILLACILTPVMGAEKADVEKYFPKELLKLKEMPFKGVTITIGVVACGPRGTISGPYYYWREEWEKWSGAKVNIVEVPFPELRAKILLDQLTRSYKFDGYNVQTVCYGDLVANSYIIPVDEFYGKYNELPGYPHWSKDTVPPLIQHSLTWGGKWYGCPDDIDTITLYYRKDILTNPEYQADFKKKYGYDLPVPPKTIAQFRDTVEFFTGWDWNGDGKPDYGWVVPLVRGAYGYMFYNAFAGTFSVWPEPGSKWHNIYFFDPDTMEPLINDPGHVRAAEKFRDLVQFGPREMISWGLGEMWDFFLKGNAAICLSPPDLPVLAQDPKKSVIKGRLGMAPMPGAMEVWDRDNNKWVKLDKPNICGFDLCGHWHGVIMTHTKHPDAVYNWFAFFSTKEISMWNVLNGWTGVDPGRTFHFIPPYGPTPKEAYLEAGWVPNDTEEFLNGTARLLATEARVPDLRIPGALEYMHVMFDALTDMLVDETISAKQTMDLVYERWEEITERFEGREAQLKWLRESRE